MVSFAALFEAGFGKYANPGDPSSGKKNPKKGTIVPIGAALDEAITAAASGQRLAETWTALAAVNGTAALQPARVDLADAGTHTDPVVGGTVPNAGEYRWNVSPAGWKRVGSTPNLAIIQASAGAADAAKPIGTDGAGKIDLSFYGNTFDQLSDQGPISGFTGDGLRVVAGAWADGTFNNPDVNIIRDFAKRGMFRRLAGFIGDSRCDMISDDVNGVTRTRAKGWFWWLQTMLRGRLDFYTNSQNLGLGGSETPVLIDQAIALIGVEPRIVFVFSGTNNFFAGGQSQEAFDDLLVAVRILTEVGGHIAVVFTDTPRGDGNGQAHSNETEMNATQRSHLLNYAQRIRRMSDMRNVIVIDSWPPLTTGTDSKAINTVFYDGLHNGLPGARLTALAAYPKLDAILPPRDILVSTNGDLYSSTNLSGALIDNPLMTGAVASVVAGVTGPLATGWTTTIGTGLSAVLSKVVASDGGPDWQQAVVSGTPANTMSAGPPVDPTNAALVVKYDMDTTDLTFGDVIDAAVDFEFDAGSAGVRGIPLYLSVTVDGTVYTCCSGEPETAADSSFPNLRMPALAFSGILQTPRMTIPAGTSIDAASIQMMVCGRNPTVVGATIRWRKATPRKVI